MINGLIRFAVSQRVLVLLMVAVLIGAGLYSLQHLPIDAVPDVTNVQVQILTAAPSLAPIEVERQITFPVEIAMSGLPGIEQIRSVSKFGLSAVSVVFEDSTDIYFARQLILERLSHIHDEHHQHEHEEPVLACESHSHGHRHAAMFHTHPHYPDIHHRHEH